MTDPTLSHTAAITQFVKQYPDSCAHVVDLPYRLCSPSVQDRNNLHIWQDETGELIGFAIVQCEFSTLDWAVAPKHSYLKETIFNWAIQRLQAIRAQREHDFGFLIGSRDPNDHMVIGVGFVHDEWAMKRLSMPLTEAVREPRVPEGIRIRPLAGLAEVGDYVALHQTAFDSRNMSIEWRARTLTHSAYQPSLDFIAEDETGEALAFCIGWIDNIEGINTGQIEPLGVLPKAQKRGIGRAILLTALQQMKQLGCQAVHIDAESTNAASNHLYESVGFTESWRNHQYFRLF